jgi:hypothetical protein
MSIRMNALQNAPDTVLRELDSLLKPDGLLVPVPYTELKGFSQTHISTWCWREAIYQVPTAELVEFLRDQIGNTKAIEIGAGNGVFGRVLGIPATDNRLQERPDIKATYASMRQPTITYGDNIVKMGGNKAVEHFKPDVVIGSWVTQKWVKGDEEGNMYGVDELDMMRRVKKYVHVGNRMTHGTKKIIPRHLQRVVYEDWLITRSMDREQNFIQIFEDH